MKQRAACIVSLAFLFTILVCSPATLAQDLHDISSMQCDNGIIDIEATKYDVIVKCGNPSFKENLGPGGEKWVYDFGSGQLIYYLTFRGTELSRIQTGEHGE
jgi:hypothetical protein